MSSGFQRAKGLLAMSYVKSKNFLLSFGLATDCKLLLLDEPTNGLEYPLKSQFRKIMQMQSMRNVVSSFPLTS